MKGDYELDYRKYVIGERRIDASLRRLNPEVGDAVEPRQPRPVGQTPPFY